METILKYTLIIFLFYSCNYNGKKVSKDEKIRFDGIYYFDNKIDTGYRDKELFKEIIRSHLDTFLHFDPFDSSIVINAYSRSTEYLKFYPDSACIWVSDANKPDFEKGFKLITQPDKDSENYRHRYNLDKGGKISFNIGPDKLFWNYRGMINKDTLLLKLYYDSTRYYYWISDRKFIFYKYPLQ